MPYVARSLLTRLAERVATGWPDADQQSLAECMAGFTPEAMQMAVGSLQSFITIHTYNTGGVDSMVRSLKPLSARLLIKAQCTAVPTSAYHATSGMALFFCFAVSCVCRASWGFRCMPARREANLNL